MASRYDSMGFKSEFGVWVRAVDYYAVQEAAEAVLSAWPHCDSRNPDAMYQAVRRLQDALYPPHPKDS